jgi:hypothetical protein
MGLTKVSNARIVKSGAWIFSTWLVYVSQRRFYRLSRSQYEAMLSHHGPVRIARDGRKTLWKIGDDFYWDTDDLDGKQIELLVWDRSRRLEAKLGRLEKIRVRAEDITTSRRERIPDDVRAFVWDRDQGRCVKCESEDNLQFDHVIPVAKGGGYGVENIQLLCGDCNLLKSDSIV